MWLENDQYVEKTFCDSSFIVRFFILSLMSFIIIIPPAVSSCRAAEVKTPPPPPPPPQVYERGARALASSCWLVRTPSSCHGRSNPPQGERRARDWSAVMTRQRPRHRCPALPRWRGRCGRGLEGRGCSHLHTETSTERFITSLSPFFFSSSCFFLLLLFYLVLFLNDLFSFSFLTVSQLFTV